MGDDGIRISQLGSEGLLLDAVGTDFSDAVQARLWALSDRLRGDPAITETVPGMNNLLVLLAPDVAPTAADALLRRHWNETPALDRVGKKVVIEVDYDGEDLSLWSEHCGLSVDELVARHSAGRYRVAALGSIPGFAYMSGLDPALAMPRRKTPRLSLEKGAVIIGGSQASLLPTIAPCGWNVIGHAELEMFDIAADPPALFAPGDEVRFVPREIRR